MTQPIVDPALRIAELETLVVRLRHDVRSALASAVLAADMMQTNSDPKVQRGGAHVVRSIERALETLDATHSIVPSRPAAADGPASG
jgi:hypothetical protein